jgi:Putative lumazine-binding
VSLPFPGAPAELRALLELLQRYFDALHTSDAALLAEVVHPTALYATATDGDLLRWSIPEYLAVVAQRESPAARGETRTDAIESIEFAGPVTAMARVRCSIGPKGFVDLLSLVKLDGRWWVMAKVFHYDLAVTDGDLVGAARGGDG